ncbi:DUF6515 family protein [Mucilaginibacter sp.]|uniref:DUF6515 family protein n=1 Tax=Mucilaginibacter sp. TaxID=1882438 RepID=UPI00283E397E|nr:DUF6515 family protein [Mucilaginibacter sp.]MDR3695518.1 hypothetical protein [Mucilaginibacter sp.]
MYKFATGLFLTGLLSVLIISTASAQRGGHSGGGGGGSVGAHFGGGSVGFHNSVGARSAFNGQVAANFHSTIAYRAGRGYFAGAGYHGGAFYRPGFGYYGYPHLGFYCGILPFGYYPFYWGADLYYYNDGIFYTPYDNGGYQVTAPPIGAGVPNLPRNANPIRIDGVQYYESDGVYYRESVDDKGKKIYVVAGRDGVLNTGDNVTDPNATVAAPKIGDMVNQLPDDCRKVNLNGKKYFISPDGIYYEKVTDPEGNVAYRIASLPSDDDKGI